MVGSLSGLIFAVALLLSRPPGQLRPRQLLGPLLEDRVRYPVVVGFGARGLGDRDGRTRAMAVASTADFLD